MSPLIRITDINEFMRCTELAPVHKRPITSFTFFAPEAAKSATNIPEEQKRCFKHPILQKWLQFVALDVKKNQTEPICESLR